MRCSSVTRQCVRCFFFFWNFFSSTSPLVADSCVLVGFFSFCVKNFICFVHVREISLRGEIEKKRIVNTYLKVCVGNIYYWNHRSRVFVCVCVCLIVFSGFICLPCFVSSFLRNILRSVIQNIDNNRIAFDACTIDTKSVGRRQRQRWWPFFRWSNNYRVCAYPACTTHNPFFVLFLS